MIKKEKTIGYKFKKAIKVEIKNPIFLKSNLMFLIFSKYLYIKIKKY